MIADAIEAEREVEEAIGRVKDFVHGITATLLDEVGSLEGVLGDSFAPKFREACGLWFSPDWTSKRLSLASPSECLDQLIHLFNASTAGKEDPHTWRGGPVMAITVHLQTFFRHVRALGRTLSEVRRVLKLGDDSTLRQSPVLHDLISQLTTFPAFASALLWVCDAAYRDLKSTAVFQLQKETFTLIFKGKKLVFGNSQPFRLLCALKEADEQFVSFADLKRQLELDRDTDIHEIKKRLVKRLTNEGFAELAAAIRAQRGHYGLLLENK